MKPLTKVCIDTNVWLSGLVFSGNPALIVDLAMKKRFELILSSVILKEIENNLVHKFKVPENKALALISSIAKVADLYEPQGTIHIIKEMHADNLVLETAFVGRAEYLVTGDKKHLLPLGTFKGIKIVTPSAFLSLSKLT